MSFPVLSTIVFLPTLGAIIIALFVREARAVKVTALIFTLATFLLAVCTFLIFDRGSSAPQFPEQVRWIPQLDVQYYLGVDGLSMPLLALNALLGFLAVLVSWGINLRPKEYFCLLLLLNSGVSGVFTALDLVLFFLFWEVELIPMFLLINIWGSGRKEYSAMKFVLYTMMGSAFMLVGIFALYFTVEPHTFDMIRLASSQLRPTIIPLSTIFLFIFLAFAIKLPVFPLHTWLPDAHTDAPTAVSVILAGILLKMGGYGMIRINASIFPEVFSSFAMWFAVLATINVVYGAAVTMMQQDLKKLIAYSSVSHMGYVLLGLSALTPIGLVGASFQMVSHGLITGLLFAMVGLVYDHTHVRHIPSLGGLSRQMPVAGTIFTVAGLASLGLPTMCGFVAEFMVFLGTYPVWTLPAILSIFAIVLTAGYILWMLQRVFHGPPKEQYNHVGDATAVERVAIFTFVALIMLLGIFPGIVTDMMGTGLRTVVGRLGV